MILIILQRTGLSYPTFSRIIYWYSISFSGTDDPTFSITQAAAQAFVFFVAGFETSSLVLQLCLYELAQNHQIQDKLREEIDRVIAKHNGEITYEGLQEMEYLDMVVSGRLSVRKKKSNLKCLS